MTEDSNMQWPHQDPLATVDDFQRHYEEHPDQMPEALRPRFEQVLADTATAATAQVEQQVSGVPGQQAEVEFLSPLDRLAELFKYDEAKVETARFTDNFANLRDKDGFITPVMAGAVLRVIKSSLATLGGNRTFDIALSEDDDLVTALTDYAWSETANDWDKVAMLAAVDNMQESRWGHAWSGEPPDTQLINHVFETLQPQVGAFDMAGGEDSATEFMRRYGKTEDLGLSVAQAQNYDNLHNHLPFSSSDPQPLVAAEVVRDFCEEYEAADPAVQKLAQEFPRKADDVLELNKYVPKLREEGIVDEEDVDSKITEIGEVLIIDTGPKNAADNREVFQISKEALDTCLEAGVKLTDFLQFMNSDRILLPLKLGKKMRQQDTDAMQEAADRTVRIALEVMKRPDIFNPTGTEAATVMGRILSVPNMGLFSRATANAEALLENYDSLIEAGYPKHILQEDLFEFIGTPTVSGEHYDMPGEMRAMHIAAPKLKALQESIGTINADDLTIKIGRAFYSKDEFMLKRGLAGIDTFCSSLDKLQSTNSVAHQTMQAILADPMFTGSGPEVIVSGMLMGNFDDYFHLAAAFDRMTDTETTAEILCALLPTSESLIAAGEHIDPSFMPTILERKLAEQDFDFLVHMYDGPNPFNEQGFGQRIADALLDNKELELLSSLPDKAYKFSTEQLSTLEAKLLKDARYYGDIPPPADYEAFLKEAIKLSPANRPFVTGKTLELFGDYASLKAAMVLHDIQQGFDSKEAEILGVTAKGEEGVKQLEQVINKFVGELRVLDISTESLDLLEQSPLLQAALKKFTRYEEPGFGNHSNAELQRLITYTNQLRRDGMLEPMPEAYKPSGIVEIQKMVVNKEREIWPEGFVARYAQLRQELANAASSFKYGEALGKTPFYLLRGGAINKIESIITDFDSKLAHPDLPAQARAGMERRRNELQALITPANPERPDVTPLQSAKSFQQNFRTLAQYNELHENLRMIFFGIAMRRNPQYIEGLRDIEWLEQERPSIKQVSAVREFVEHIVNQETFGKYFKDKKSATAFKKITNMGAFNDALKRYDKISGVGGATKLQFIPTRGLGLELSGHIADACWASKYPSIAEEMPNMTAVIMKQNPGDPHKEKLVGSGLLIETTGKIPTPDGNIVEKPMLVIRGLNPIEDYINRTVSEDFFNKFTEYARAIAEERGMELGIVIDRLSGRAGTNRPMLFNYMSGLKQSLVQVSVSAAETTFNGYNVSDQTFLLPAA